MYNSVLYHTLQNCCSRHIFVGRCNFILAGRWTSWPNWSNF